MEKTFITTEKQLKIWLANFDATVFSLDLETTGLEYGCEIEGVSICDGKKACYIDYEKIGAEYLYVIAKLLEHQATGIIFHNAAFDLRVLKQWDFNIKAKIFCTLVAANMLNENESCGLKQLTKRVLKIDPKLVLTYKQASDMGQSTKKFYDYAINDAIWTWKLYEKEKPLIEKQGLHYLFYDVEMPFQNVLIDLFINGIKIDKKKLAQFEKFLTKERVKYEELTYNSIGVRTLVETDLFGGEIRTPPMNLNSSSQIAKVILNKGLKLPKTEKGNYSTGEEVLSKLKNEMDFIKYLLKYRKAEKQLNTFCRPYFDLIDDDGRIRTSFNDCVAVTGRLSSSHPNLQNIPRKSSEDDLVNVRELFIAKRGYKFVRADYNGQELRQLANVTNDPTLVNAFNTNKDLHLVTANGCLNLDIPREEMVQTHPGFVALKKKFGAERHIGKNGINFPIIYGSTAVGIARGNKVTEKIAQGWIDGFFKMYPDVKKAIVQCKKEAYQNHYVTNHFGRRRRFENIDNKAIRQAFNFKIQGSCADVLRIVMVQLRQLYINNPAWDAKLVLTVHDSIDTEVREEFAQACLEKTKEIMENAVVLQVPFIVDISIGDDIDG